MARFNLDEYDLVENRIARFLEDHPDGRIITSELTSADDRDRKYWVVQAKIFIDHEDQHMNCPKATGLAFEIEGTGGANATSALENAETSAIGRALANMGYSGKKRPSQEEMKKVARAENPVTKEFLGQVENAESLTALNALWPIAVDSGWADELLKTFQARKSFLENKKG